MSNCTFAHAFFGIRITGAEYAELYKAMTEYSQQQAELAELDSDAELPPGVSLDPNYDPETCPRLFPPAVIAQLRAKYGFPEGNLLLVPEEDLIDDSSPTIEGEDILFGKGCWAFPQQADQMKAFAEANSSAQWHQWVSAEQ